MPHAIPIVLTYIATSVLGITTWNLGTAIAIAFLAQFTGQLQENNRRQPEIDLGARLVQRFTEAAPRRIIYGKAKVAPQPIAFSEMGNFSLIVYAVCEHYIDRIDGVYLNNGKFLNDTEINTLNTVGHVAINSWSSSDGDDLGELRRQYGDSSDRVNKTEMRIIKADPGSLDRKLSAYGDIKIDIAGMRALNTTCIALILPSPSRISSIRNGDTRAIFGSPPSIQLDVDRGRRNITGPYWAGSDYNAAAAFRDYVTKYTDYGQKIFGRSRLDTPSFNAAITACETEGYEAHGMVTLTDSNEVVFDQFMLAMGGGWVSDNGGILYVRPNTSLTAVSTITADHVLPNWSVIPQTPRANRISDVTISHINDEGEIDTTTYHLEQARQQFGDKERTLEAAFIRGSDQAYKLAETIANRAYHTTEIELDMNASGLALIPGDVVNVDLPKLGLDHEQKFTIVSKRINPDMTTTIGLSEYSTPPAAVELTTAEAEITWADGTASMAGLTLDVPSNIIEGGRGGSPTLNEVTYWQSEFVAGTAPNPDIIGWADGSDFFASWVYGSHTSGSLTIPANTIPGITSDRVTGVVYSRRRGSVHDFILGYEPDTESEDQMIFPSDARFQILRNGVILFSGAFADAIIGQDNHPAERFLWHSLPLSTRLADGDSFTARIIRPGGGPNPNYTPGMQLTGVDLVAPRIGQNPPIYTQYGDIRLTLNGVQTGEENPDARIAIINTSRTFEGDRVLVDHWLWSSRSTESDSNDVTTIYTPVRFLARFLDTDWTYGIEDDDTFKVVLYEASGPLPSDLLSQA